MIKVVTGELIGMPEMMAEMDRRLTAQIWLLLVRIGDRVVDRLRAHTSETRPPARRGGEARQAHWGHWADVTGLLARSYRSEVVKGSSGYTELHLINDDPKGYGAILEAREGFFVLRTVGDKNGPVDQETRKAVAELTDWQITHG